MWRGWGRGGEVNQTKTTTFTVARNKSYGYIHNFRLCACLCINKKKIV